MSTSPAASCSSGRSAHSSSISVTRPIMGRAPPLGSAGGQPRGRGRRRAPTAEPGRRDPRGVGAGGPRGADPTRSGAVRGGAAAQGRRRHGARVAGSPCTCSTARRRSTRRWPPCSSSTAPWCARWAPAPDGWPRSCVGMSIAWLVGSLVGVTWWSMVLVMFVALLIGRWRRLGDHGIQVPTMVLLSLITVNGTDTDFTYLTIVETVLGGVVGVAVNAVVLAPMHLDEPRDALRDLTTRVQDVLGDIADGPARGLGRRPGPALVPPRDRPAATGSPRRCRRWRPAARAPGGTGGTGCARPGSTGTATCAPSRRCAAPSGRWPASPAPSSTPPTTPTGTRRRPRDWLRSYADVLDEVGEAISHFGVWTDDSRGAVRAARRPGPRGARRDERGGAAHPARRPPRVAGLRRPGARGRAAGPRAALEQRRGVGAHRHRARSGCRSPRACPPWRQLQQQVPAVGEQLPRIIERVSALGRPPADPPPPEPAEAGSDAAEGPARPS